MKQFVGKIASSQFDSFCVKQDRNIKAHTIKHAHFEGNAFYIAGYTGGRISIERVYYPELYAYHMRDWKTDGPFLSAIKETHQSRMALCDKMEDVA